jgi:hypothetical protein
MGRTGATGGLVSVKRIPLSMFSSFVLLLAKAAAANKHNTLHTNIMRFILRSCIKINSCFYSDIIIIYIICAKTQFFFKGLLLNFLPSSKDIELITKQGEINY